MSTNSGRHVLAFAHRGGAGHPQLAGLENTLTAFRHAVGLGYRYVETDVHLSRDGVLLAFHDDRLDRVTDRHGAVAEQSLAEIKRARIAGREQIPALAELIEAVPGDVVINIDLKAPGTPAALARFLDEHSMHERVIVGSFDVARLTQFRRLSAGRVRTSAHPREVAAYLLSPGASLARLAAGDGFVAFQVPHRRRVLGREIPIVTPGFLHRAHARGVQVHVWTVDDPAEMRELIALGVDGLITDRTDLLKQVLLAEGIWAETPRLPDL